MDQTLEPGLTAKVTYKVTENDTAAVVGSGEVKVYGTPRMLALMEEAAYRAVKDCLEEGDTTVGTHLDAVHTAATPVGMDVWATAEVVEVAGKKVVFKVEAFDEKECIGKGSHTRYIVNGERFHEKTAAKLQ